MLQHQTLGAGGRWQQAREIFEQVKQARFKPDVSTYTALLAAYHPANKWRPALQVCFPYHAVLCCAVLCGACAAMCCAVLCCAELCCAALRCGCVACACGVVLTWAVLPALMLLHAVMLHAVALHVVVLDAVVCAHVLTQAWGVLHYAEMPF